ncbi:amino acid transporter [Methylobacterium sp. J-070]|uniref:amino acid transporter n=1 Tax=Methylobacterium sp. J-070 TaxID=2836650 RepID=UPI001FB9FE03|nr:amino acid transporter [Methylobacterium sp. J-070]MCJ2054757.1 amino acid transporter [Methylobacterium sp. J-070]
MSKLEDDKAEAERLKAMHNERTKLTATYMNGVAIAAIAVGGLAPIAQNHFETMSDLEIGLFFVKLVLCLVASFGLHLGASFLLRGMK